jgi:hypothetical protein
MHAAATVSLWQLINPNPAYWGLGALSELGGAGGNCGDTEADGCVSLSQPAIKMAAPTNINHPILNFVFI